ncbi:MAG: hypothetical protein KIT84_00265 [Labilithrix sp.]|nr:hypothetical protein [Labilithrix sp.]MCW5809416.1 hypothetical protein [Labilithrix sp.]
MKIDRSRFLALTAGIAAVTACAAPEHPVVRVEVPPPRPESAPTDAGGLAEVEYREPPPPPPAPPPAPAACPENAIGSLAACTAWTVDPSCESGGPRSECTSLLDMGGKSSRGEPEGFQPRVAEKIAACMTAKPVVRATGCKRPDMHKCVRAGVDAVCIEPEMKEACEKIVESCKTRRAPPTFTVEQCAKIASATRGSLRDWALEKMAGRHSDGTPMAEGCTLEYVTVYQPWPRNWWTGK